MRFYHPRKGSCSLEDVLTQIRDYVQEVSSAEYKVMIGTDSQTRTRETTFVTAIIIQRIGKGALFFYRKKRHKAMKDLRYRIYRETEYSLEVVEKLKQQGFFRFIQDLPMEIHLDVGQQGETRKLIQEVVGWVTAVGYEAKIKPDSYAASAVADRFTR
ncbi:ribonuclease H-like YkuK family protein [Risungbinella massiliensis]|uniref:ribonuclease H-like YkuK family protein n=1 Tax=Risungbinella massiliensis TaxID=1329796 RepID=UPI0005CC8EFA|nr:ribonuclease H-like YkuK family protein [Risungbinella massiliensis]